MWVDTILYPSMSCPRPSLSRDQNISSLHAPIHPPPPHCDNNVAKQLLTGIASAAPSLRSLDTSAAKGIDSPWRVDQAAAVGLIVFPQLTQLRVKGADFQDGLGADYEGGTSGQFIPGALAAVMPALRSLEIQELNGTNRGLSPLHGHPALSKVVFSYLTHFVRKSGVFRRTLELALLQLSRIHTLPYTSQLPRDAQHVVTSG